MGIFYVLAFIIAIIGGIMMIGAVSHFIFFDNEKGQAVFNFVTCVVYGYILGDLIVRAFL